MSELNMQHLHTIDYVIVVAYFVVLIGIGVALRRIASQSMESYFLAGNKLPWWMLGVSGMGYSLDIAGTMLIISLLYLLGPRGLFIEFRGGVSLALLCQMIWTGKWHRRSGCMTVAEWMTFRFGSSRGANFARLATAVCFIVFATSMLVYMAKGVGLFLSLFLPFSPFICALILLGVATIYTAMSGLYGVVVSDLFQCGLILLGAIYVVVLAVGAMDDGAGLAALAEKLTGQANWSSSFPNFFEPNMPPGYEQYSHLLVYTMFFLVLNKLIINGFGTGHEPQFFAARDERECGKLAALWAVLMTFRWPMMIAYAILGLYLVQDFFPSQEVTAQAADMIRGTLNPSEAQWAGVLAGLKNSPETFPTELVAGLQEILGKDWSQKLDLLSYHGTVNAERILPSVLLHKIGPGFRGLILVTLISASMSTFDMTMNKAAAMFTNDIFRRFLRPGATNRQLMTATYAFFAVTLVLAFFMAYYVPNINSIWGWIMMGLWSGIGMPLLLRFYWWRFNGAGFALGVFGGLLAAVGVLAWNTLFPEHEMSEIMQFLVLTPVSIACAVGGTYLAPPTEQDVLADFYRKTRPFGRWAPLRHVLSSSDYAAMRREHRNDLIALPLGFVWMVSMYLLPMQLMIGQYLASSVTAVLFVAACLGLYKFWYLALPAPAFASTTSRSAEVTPDSLQ